MFFSAVTNHYSKFQYPTKKSDSAVAMMKVCMTAMAE
jgi:hypothetical protein